jgi:hypothetical protein
VDLTDKERYQYQIDRGKRDIVDNKPKPPMTDKVLQRALDHLRSEFAKQQ